MHMYLFHKTSISHLKSILESGQIKSSKMTSNISEGSGVYTTNDFVYFSVTDTLFDPKTKHLNMLYLSSDVLSNQPFYVSNSHTNTPDVESENFVGDRLWYQRAYPAHYVDIDRVLHDLYT